MRRRSLTPAPGDGPARVHAEARGLQRVEPADAGARERPVGVLLEDDPQALERALRPPLDPAAEAQLLLEPLARRAGLHPDREADPRQSAADRLEAPDDAAPRPPPPTRLRALDEPARPVGLDDRGLDPGAPHGRIELVARTGAHAARVGMRKAELRLVVVTPGHAHGEVRDQVEDLLARRGDVSVQLDREHPARDSMERGSRRAAGR